MKFNQPMITLLFACVALTPALGQVRDHDPAWGAPLRFSSKLNPFASRSDVVAGGAKVFRQRCASCHGDTGHGSRNAPDLTKRAVQAQPDGALFWKITTGNTHRGMPTFSFLPEPQRWQLVLQVRALGTAE